MNVSMRKYMKVGIILHMAFDGLAKGEGPILENLEKIVKDDYFEVVEVTQIKDPMVRKAAADMIKCGHMEVAYGGQPRLLTTGMNINDLDEEKRKAAVQSLKEGIDEAYELNAVGFSYLAGKYEEDRKEEAFQALIKSSKELCEYAKSKGDMPVVLEIFDYDIDKKSLIGPTYMAKRLAEIMTAEYDNFGLMVDSSHIPMLHETLEESLFPIKDYIKHAHMGNTVIKDSKYPAYGDTHPRFGFPNSENDVEELADYLRMLIKIGYLSENKRSIVSFEVKPFGNEDSEIVIANAKRTLNLAWELV
ncbi:TIM barrel protein [Defluviitalea phaphyphila]|uniref:TIM barrel protein n=1 Tax=Defluviitalea phaphyphila TaxID=1473580 RepID=UPI0007305801|nr:TIM barrel protein [Defluviitalea phaphyphila]